MNFLENLIDRMIPKEDIELTPENINLLKKGIKHGESITVVSEGDIDQKVNLFGGWEVFAPLYALKIVIMRVNADVEKTLKKELTKYVNDQIRNTEIYKSLDPKAYRVSSSGRLISENGKLTFKGIPVPSDLLMTIMGLCSDKTINLMVSAQTFLFNGELIERDEIWEIYPHLKLNEEFLMNRFNYEVEEFQRNKEDDDDDDNDFPF